MPNPRSPYRSGAQAGFTLPAILVVVGALLILAVGILLVTNIERSTARSFVDRERAELAAKAGLEELKGILLKEAANDDFTVIQSTLAAPITAGTQTAPHLFLVRGESKASAYSYRYVPLFSSIKGQSVNSKFEPPTLEPLVGNSTIDYNEFTTLPYNDKVRVSWLPVKDDAGRTVARYAFWVEDLQGRLDPKLIGNQDGTGLTHTRAAWPFPAAGLNPKPESTEQMNLNQVALFSIDPAATVDSQGDLEKNFFKNRKALISPESLQAAAETNPILTRITDKSAGFIGELVEKRSRAVEEGLVSGIQTYLEQPIVPYAEGIDPSVAGKPKLNLNKLIATGGADAVDEMATFIKKALPGFENRKGGFPDNYLKTLAANAIDYADTDKKATLGTDYRGLDAYPLVSEFLMRFRWDDVKVENGRKYVMIKVATYVELWNMTDKVVSGDVEVTHDTRYSFPLGANPEVSLADMTDATPVLAKSDGSYWYPAQTLSLNPNEYRLIKCGEVTYKLDAGTAAFFVPSPLLLQNEKYGESKATYKMKWNGQVVDQARGGIHRNDCSLKYPTGDKQAVRTTIPGHSYAGGPGAFIDNMGDSRMCYYLSAPQDASAYPANYSPNRRNIRYQIYKGDGSTKPKVYGRVLPAEWPDGGHNSTCESTAGLTQSNTQLDPDASVFQLAAGSVLRNPPADEAPMRLSGLPDGWFYSATELGRVYDPIMWNTATPSGAGLPWGDVLTSTAADPRRGGGNTLRIGRPEHPMFDKPDQPGLEAYHLLDLFHAGRSRSASAADREGLLVLSQGQVNINTAGRDALRAIAVGALTMDPKMSKRTSDNHDILALMAPPVNLYKMPASEINNEANRIADAIILRRKTTPFPSPAALAEVRDSPGAGGKPLFGNKDLIADGTSIERSDSAAEEIFARVYEASTVRSRNYRVWIVGQSLAPTKSTTAAPEVLSEVRKVFNVFADPGERTTAGTIDPSKCKITVTHENDF